MKKLIAVLSLVAGLFLANIAMACGTDGCNPPPPPPPPVCGPTDCATWGGGMFLNAVSKIAAFGQKVEGSSTTAWLMSADLGYNEALEAQDFIVTAGSIETSFKGKDVLSDSPLMAGTLVDFMAKWGKNTYW
jgi:hypothetical protein